MKEDWTDLIKAITIMSKHPGSSSPTHCEHDIMRVMADPSKFTLDEISKLEELHFHADWEEECFYSFYYGSA